MSIKVLSPEVASQIAAGEVIERPASVVKELLENAVDAGATQIVVRVEGAGQRLVEVADNGSGIPAGELRLAVERHATSKLRSAEDLFQIATLGFRGEALASIGSVSRLTLTSRLPGEAAGARLRVEGGLRGDLQPVGVPVGTVVRVEDLFFNVPARRKFLKKEGTEHRQIDGLVTRYALAYPQIRFQLFQEGRPSLQTSGNGDRREVLAALYGVEIARQMLEVLAEEGDLRLTGFTSPTGLTRSNRREMTFFVNGRPVQDAALISALLKAYQTLLMVGKYPQAILFLDLPPQAVDVNVHPAKAEVRFREADRVYSFIHSAVRRALLAYAPVPQVTDELRWRPVPSEGMDESLERGSDTGRWLDPVWGADHGLPETREHPAESVSPQSPGSLASEQPPLTAGRVPLLRLVGQVASTYLVAEGPDGLYLVDQHAAHERVLFERFLAQREEGQVPAQALLQAAVVELPPDAARLASDGLPVLSRLGFVVEPFGPGAFLVRSVPALLARMDPASALRVLIEDFEEDETPLQAEVEARIIARVCKRAAVKAGQTLSPQEQRALLSDLEACQSPRTCPHGRPTMIHLSVDILERQFGRKGPR